VTAAASRPPSRRLAINRLRERKPLDADAVDRFLGRHEVPIVEGTRCTFLYRGEADEVFLAQRIVGLPELLPLRPLRGTDLWYLVLELPEGSRVNYQLQVRRGDHVERINDPLNQKLSYSPVGTSSVCFGYGYESPEWTMPDPDARPGELVEMTVRSRALRRDCPVTVYLPARFRRTGSYPLLVVHDGPDFLQYAAAKTVLDNLIHRLDVAQTVVAFLMGSSFGAVASLSAAVRSPDLYGSLILMSGSFVFTDIGAADHGGGEVFDPVVRFVNKYRARPTHVADRMFVSCGVYEPLIVPNRSMVPVFESAGMTVRYVEARDGHNWENWRDRLRDALSWVYPGPQKFYYE
jgi:enterochelin esterase-like enzyme